MPIAKIEAAIEDIRQGKMVILVDDEDRENEGDLAMAAELVTPEAINFMAKEGRGLICLSLTEQRADFLELPLMVRENTSSFGTAFTVSIEARRGVSTGISAADRARTIQVAIADETTAMDLARPGHVFPLRAKKGGVLVRAGQTEGSVDLARLAGLKPAGVICEIMNDDGTMARLPELKKFAKQHDLKIISIADLVSYRMRKELLVRRAAETVIPIHDCGEFVAIAYENDVDKAQHLALVKGVIDPEKPVLVRVHSECLTGDILGSLKCDCGPQLDGALHAMAHEAKDAGGWGVLLYLRQEGRGIGLINKLRAYRLQDQGFDTVEANQRLGLPDEARDFPVAARMLELLGATTIRLLTNNPAKVTSLEAAGITVSERVAHQLPENPHNARYLATKRDRSGHLLI